MALIDNHHKEIFLLIKTLEHMNKRQSQLNAKNDDGQLFPIEVFNAGRWPL